MMWGGLVFEFELIGDKGDAFADSVTGGNFYQLIQVVIGP